MLTAFRHSLWAALLLATAAHAEGAPVHSSEYAGSQTCIGCHQSQAESWASSHHALAWTEPTPETVLGDFDDSVFEHRGHKTRFFRDNDRFLIETTDFPGSMTVLPVVGVAGIAPLQQYLIETEPGRLQSLDIAWDTERGRWYHIYPDQELPPEDGYHWSGPYKNWNARCAECHATGFQKNYSLRTRSYQSIQAEIGVGCEACHGPGAAHLAWAKGDAATSEGADIVAKGLMSPMVGVSGEAMMQQCAGCHSRREPFEEGNPLPGTPYHDAYRLALLRDGLYHADGQILDEVYVYGSFLQSKMYSKGVTCTDCHDPHSARLKADGNAICTQCHSPAGNPEFPTLVKRAYDDAAHHFHIPDTEGAACVSCHMIERTYMGVDGRRDHSFRVPRPDLSVSIGTPNACNDCHDDRDAAWAAASIAERYPSSAHRGPHYGETFAAARAGTPISRPDLLRMAHHDAFPAIVRANALDLLAQYSDAELAEETVTLLEDTSPLVRSGALRLQQGAGEPERSERILKGLADPVKSVRIAAARQALSLDPRLLPADAAPTVRSASSEWQSTLAAKADFPEAHLTLGGTALGMRNLAAAKAAFSEAVALDPQLVEAWGLLVRIHLAENDLAEAERTLQRALSLVLNDPELLDLKERLDGVRR